MKGSGASQAAVCGLAEHALREKWESWGGRERASTALRCPAGAHVPGGGPRIPAGCPCPGEVPRGCPCLSEMPGGCPCPSEVAVAAACPGPHGHVPPGRILG